MTSICSTGVLSSHPFAITSWDLSSANQYGEVARKHYMGLSSPPFWVDGVRNISILRNFTCMENQSVMAERLKNELPPATRWPRTLCKHLRIFAKDSTKPLTFQWVQRRLKSLYTWLQLHRVAIGKLLLASNVSQAQHLRRPNRRQRTKHH
jgi:hypothetical protein